jgi:hypothetical protein
MNDQKEIVLQLEDNALAHSPHTRNTLPGCRADWRIHRAEEKWLGDPHPFEWLTHHSRGESLEINRDVRQLGHRWYPASTNFGLPSVERRSGERALRESSAVMSGA